jgi:hypothetical protein
MPARLDERTLELVIKISGKVTATGLITISKDGRTRTASVT